MQHDGGSDDDHDDDDDDDDNGDGDDDNGDGDDYDGGGGCCGYGDKSPCCCLASRNLSPGDRKPRVSEFLKIQDDLEARNPKPYAARTQLRVRV